MKAPKSHQAQPLPPQRTFSTEFKRAIVHDIEHKLVTVGQVADEYQVSRTSVYRWIERFCTSTSGKPHRVVLERDSEQYQTKQLRQRVLELEATLGRKQLMIDYLNELIAVSSTQLDVDLKKTFDSSPSTPSAGNARRRTGQ